MLCLRLHGNMYVHGCFSLFSYFLVYIRRKQRTYTLVTLPLLKGVHSRAAVLGPKLWHDLDDAGVGRMDGTVPHTLRT